MDCLSLKAGFKRSALNVRKTWVFALICLFVFNDGASLCGPDCPGTHSTDKTGLVLRDPRAYTS